MDMGDVDCFWRRGDRCTHPKVGGKPCQPCEFIKPRNLTAERRVVPLTAGQKALAYVKAEASLVLKGPVSKEELVKRLETCNGCENLERSEAEGELGWCDKCGCGRAARAELTVKGRMPAATCPYHLWIKEGAPRAPLSEELRRAIDA